MNNSQIIQQFYTAFSNGHVDDMLACYHENVVFRDPAFGTLRGDRAGNMWKMLLSSKTTNLNITFGDIEADDEQGKANWVAEYHYGPKKRKVINHVSADFTFKEDKIIQHTDTFNLWKWTQQALGPMGYLMGWTPFMKKRIQQMTNKRLDAFMARDNVA